VYDVNNKQEQNSHENLYRKHFHGGRGISRKKNFFRWGITWQKKIFLRGDYLAKKFFRGDYLEKIFFNTPKKNPGSAPGNSNNVSNQKHLVYG